MPSPLILKFLALKGTEIETTIRGTIGTPASSKYDIPSILGQTYCVPVEESSSVSMRKLVTS